MRKNIIQLIVVPCLLLSGCATIFSGRQQSLQFDTTPQGARCELLREGHVIGAVDKTPGAVLIEKNKYGIDVVCSSPGYSDTKTYLKSGWDGAVLGNLLLGGLIGWGIDSAVGADNRYADQTSINLISGPSTTISPPAPKKTKEEIRRQMDAIEQLHRGNILTDEEYRAKKGDLEKAAQ